MKIAVIGGGLFGLCTALELDKHHDVDLFESKSDILLGASKNNHNRIHYGFHYPRSIETAEQSLYGYKIFKEKFKESIVSDFENYYLVESSGLVNEVEYEKFCDYLSLDYVKRSPSVNVNMDKISASFLTKEPIFDYDKIYELLKSYIEKSNINIHLNSTIKDKEGFDDYDIIVNATYQNINSVGKLFGFEKMKLKMQYVVIPIFKWNNPKIGLTIMDGKFCSIMPKGNNKNTFLLYHVDKSVLLNKECYFVPEKWDEKIKDKKFISEKIKEIVDHSTEYYPFIKDLEIIDHWCGFRALPLNEDDNRVSDIHVNHYGNKKIFNILSGKVTTCWVIADKIKNIIENEYVINR